MKNNCIRILLSIFIVLFSFFYTNKIIRISKDNDPIMIEIKKLNEIYSDTKQDSIIIDNDIIPGMIGKKVDIDKSYQIMKKTGRFDKNLLVFQESIPKKSIKNNYKKYIISLNQSQNIIGLVFVLDNTDNLSNIMSILNSKNINATFFLKKEIFDNSFNLVKQLIDNGNQVELLSDTYTVYEVNKYNSYMNFFTKEKLIFCLNINKEDKLLQSCDNSKLYTISPNRIISNNIYLYVKENLTNGLILALSNNNSVLRELSSTINYIKQKGKKFVLLKSLVE